MPTLGSQGKAKVKYSKATTLPKIKMGAPSKLSTSQRRKLVRLYFYTNIALPDICTVLSVGHKEIK